MASGQWSGVLRHVQRAFGGGGVAGLSEGQLLDRFVAGRDEVAFGALVARHGAMVLGVCRGVLDDPADVEDAFQATFLVLVRKAGGLRDRDLLASWLHGVARKVALRARADAARRRARERAGAGARGEAVAAPDAGRRELQSMVREEVDRLPANDRMAVALCYLEGLTHEEAARRLGWPVGTVKGRLSRARDRLRSRLVRRGVALPVAAVASTLARGASAAVPPPLIASTTLAAARLASGHPPAAGIASAHALALMEGVIRTMFATQLKIVAATLAATCALATPGVLAYQGVGPAGDSPKAQPPGEPAPKAPSAPSVDDARAVQAEFAGRAVKLFDQLIAKGQASPSDAAYLAWSRRLAEAKSAPGVADEDRRAALRAHLTRMEAHHEKMKAGLKDGKVSKLEELESAYRLNEAYLWTLDDGALPRAPAPAGGGGFGEGGGGGFGGGGGAAPARKPVAIQTLPADEERNQLILAKLEQRISMTFPNDTPLEDVKRYIEQSTRDEAGGQAARTTKDEAGGLPAGIPIYVDPQGLQDADKTMASTVTMNLEGIPLRTTLRLLLRQLGLDYRVEGGLLLISDEASMDDPKLFLPRSPFDTGPKPGGSR